MGPAQRLGIQELDGAFALLAGDDREAQCRAINAGCHHHKLEEIREELRQLPNILAGQIEHIHQLFRQRRQLGIHQRQHIRTEHRGI
ncbi:hypothetical protein SDC9_202869 [bioreactor metagenome]|uniref:Uncharacterized protein n=1 Tax=bioreactor metagenome TaxID=1076179 RepID=A0A645IWD9_9ZZZZ